MKNFFKDYLLKAEGEDPEKDESAPLDNIFDELKSRLGKAKGKEDEKDDDEKDDDDDDDEKFMKSEAFKKFMCSDKGKKYMKEQGMKKAADDEGEDEDPDRIDELLKSLEDVKAGLETSMDDGEGVVQMQAADLTHGIHGLVDKMGDIMKAREGGISAELKEMNGKLEILGKAVLSVMPEEKKSNLGKAGDKPVNFDKTVTNHPEAGRTEDEELEGEGREKLQKAAKKVQNLIRKGDIKDPAVISALGKAGTSNFNVDEKTASLLIKAAEEAN